MKLVSSLGGKLFIFAYAQIAVNYQFIIESKVLVFPVDKEYLQRTIST